MKVEITHPGCFDGKGKEIKVGTVIKLKEDDIPAPLLNKCRPVGKVSKAQKFITNPAKKEDNGDNDDNDRAELFNKLVDDLDEEKDFTGKGLPDVAALNALLEEDEDDFTASERNELWEAHNEE